MAHADARALLARKDTCLHLDCSSGIAGDMLVAALLDLGASEQRVREAVAGMALDGLEGLRVTRVSKHGLDALDFDVMLDEAHHNHDHDMAWLHGDHAHGHHHDHGDHDAEKDHAHEHHHEHGHGDHGHHHHHEHRTLADVERIVRSAPITEHARDIALAAFGILADAEAAAHGTTRDEVHFHEVGAVDSIVDVVAAAVCLDDLGVTRCVIESVTDGRGTIRFAHGLMPIPVPAVTNIAIRRALPLRTSEVMGELVTPTGAALAATVMTGDTLPERRAICAMGVGAGKRGYECAGVLRAMVVRDLDAVPADDETRVWKLECDIDDATGEALGALTVRLMEVGAREAHYLPTLTKKGRPAWQLQVICTDGAREALELEIFRSTTTIGIRRVPFERTVLPREAICLPCEPGPVAAKAVTLPDGTRRAYPEFDDVERLAAQGGLATQDVWQAAMGACAAWARQAN